MNTSRKLAALTSIGALLIAANASQGANLFQIANSDGKLKGAIFYVDYAFRGIVGDYIEVDEGTHLVSVVVPTPGEPPRRLRLTFRIASEGNEVWTMEQEVMQGCYPEKIWEVTSWDKIGVERDHRYTGVIIVDVPTPLMHATDDHHMCPVPMMVSPKQAHQVIRIESDPQGAEIWLDGERLEYKTNISLSIPYYYHDRTVESARPRAIVLRKEGRINCFRVVEFGAEAARCDLPTPQEWKAAQEDR